MLSSECLRVSIIGEIGNTTDDTCTCNTTHDTKTTDKSKTGMIFKIDKSATKPAHTCIEYHMKTR